MVIPGLLMSVELEVGWMLHKCLSVWFFGVKCPNIFNLHTTLIFQNFSKCWKSSSHSEVIKICTLLKMQKDASWNYQNTKTPKSHRLRDWSVLFGSFHKFQQCHSDFLSLHCFFQDSAWLLLHFLMAWAYLPLPKRLPS